MGTYEVIDGQAGEFVTCPSCHGWDISETGLYCRTCYGEGVIFEPYPDKFFEDQDEAHGRFESACRKAFK